MEHDNTTPKDKQFIVKTINDYTLEVDGVTYDMAFETWYRLSTCKPSEIDGLFKSLVASGAIWRVNGGAE